MKNKTVCDAMQEEFGTFDPANLTDELMVELFGNEEEKKQFHVNKALQSMPNKASWDLSKL